MRRASLLALILATNVAHAGVCESALGWHVRRFVAGTLALVSVGAGEARPTVDLQLVLATDVSGSISDPSYALQKEGIARAVRSAEVLEAIQTCAPRGVALAYTEWDELYEVRVAFRRVSDPRSLADFAHALARLDRAPGVLNTDIEGALRGSMALLEAEPWPAGRRVIDISSDGIQNVARGGQPKSDDEVFHERLGRARDEIVAADVTINALVIDDKNEASPNGGETSLEAYFRRRVIGGPGAFTQKISKMIDVREGLARKMAREICSVHF